MTTPEYESAFSTLSDPDKHRIAMIWAFRSIYQKEPTVAKIDYLVGKYGDINAARKAMVTEMCDCSEQLKAQAQVFQTQMAEDANIRVQIKKILGC